VHVGEAGQKSITVSGNDTIEIRSAASERKDAVDNGNILFPDIAVAVYVDVGE
jgi:hypothetical protein